MPAGVDMADCRTWPLGDLLPLVRRTGGLWPDVGVLIADYGPVIYLTDALTPGLHRRLVTCERETHLTFASILEAGWMPD